MKTLRMNLLSMQSTVKLLLVLTLASASLPTTAQVTQQWIDTVAPASDYIWAPTLTVVDHQGNPIMAGTTGDFMGGYGAGTVDGMVLSKYDNSGNLTWTATYADFMPNAIATDGSGNIILVGETGDLNDDETWPRVHDAMVLKYDGNGQLLWVHTIGGTYYDNFNSVALDALGNIYCAGQTATNTWPYNAKGLLVKYSPSGQELWVSAFGSNSAYGTVAVGNGVVYAAGSTTNAALLVKYNSTTGAVSWSTSFASEMTPAYWVDLVLDGNDNAYVTGSIASGSKNSFDFNITTAKYNSSGVLQWSKAFDGSASDSYPKNNQAKWGPWDYASAIGIDANNNVYVSGNAYNKSGSGKNASNSHDIVLIKYTATGTQTWASTYGQSNSIERVGSMVVNGSGIYLAGSIYVGGAPNHTVTVKYNHAGNLNWDIILSNSTGILGMHLDVIGADIYVGTGWEDLLLVKYTEASGSSKREIAELGNAGIAVFPNPAQHHIHINAGEGIALGIVQILDIQGRVVMEQSIQEPNGVINISGLARGMYFVKTQAAPDVVPFIRN